LEWRVPSPPPLENFDEIPVVTGGPYVHDKITYIMHPGNESENGTNRAESVIKEES
jgi:hypothetical protein